MIFETVFCFFRCITIISLNYFVCQRAHIRYISNPVNKFNTSQFINQNQYLLEYYNIPQYRDVLKSYEVHSFPNLALDKSTIYPIENDFAQVKPAIESLLVSNKLKVQSEYLSCGDLCQHLKDHQNDFYVEVSVGYAYESFIYKVDILFIHRWDVSVFEAMPIYIKPDVTGLENIPNSFCNKDLLEKAINKQMFISKNMKMNLAMYCYIPLTFAQESSLDLQSMVYNHINTYGVKVLEWSIFFIYV